MSAYAFNKSINLSLIIKFFSILSLCLYVLEKNCCLYCGNSKSNLLFLWTNSKIVNLLVKNFVTFFTSSSLSLLTRNFDFKKTIIEAINKYSEAISILTFFRSSIKVMYWLHNSKMGRFFKSYLFL